MSNKILGVIFDLDGVIVTRIIVIIWHGNAWQMKKVFLLTAR